MEKRRYQYLLFVLLGLAAGDRIGGPIRMALLVAESLLACGCFGPADVQERYLRWWEEGAFDTGPVSGRAFALLAAGMPPADAVAQVHQEFGSKTAGCNPAHRASPLAMLASIRDEQLAGCAKVEARLTHYDALAGDVAARRNIAGHASGKPQRVDDSHPGKIEGGVPRIKLAPPVLDRSNS